MSTKPSSEETPDLQGAFPRLSDAQIAALDAQGRRRVHLAGEVLFAEGDRECDFFVVLAGRWPRSRGTGRWRSVSSPSTARPGIDLRADPQALQRLFEAAEKAKVELSSLARLERLDDRVPDGEGVSARVPQRRGAGPCRPGRSGRSEGSRARIGVRIVVPS